MRMAESASAYGGYQVLQFQTVDTKLKQGEIRKEENNIDNRH